MEEKVFQNLVKEKVAAIEDILDAFLPPVEGYQKTMLDGMQYSLKAGGKRLRPMLMQESFQMFSDTAKKHAEDGLEIVSENGSESTQMEAERSMLYCFMAALEMIHTYSLVHDDLPDMDNDTLRRGRETTWKVYGPAAGILIGDALLNYAFETAADAFSLCESLEQYKRCGQALQVLSAKAGVFGMAGGQMVDVEAEKMEHALSSDELLFIHENKTAALIQAALMVGAILGGADESQIDLLEECGSKIGLAFQIQDDILDVIGTDEELGKPIGSDAENGKQTFVTIYGLEKSALEVDRLSKEAVAILQSIPGEHVFLENLVLSLIGRRK